MKAKAIISVLIITAIAVCAFTGCAKQDSTPETTVPETTIAEPVTKLPKTDMTKWRYSKENDLYYQTGILYCETPADEKFEKLAYFIPAAYMDAQKNAD